jgi:hypothetical protein
MASLNKVFPQEAWPTMAKLRMSFAESVCMGALYGREREVKRLIFGRGPHFTFWAMPLILIIIFAGSRLRLELGAPRRHDNKLTSPPPGPNFGALRTHNV